MRNWDLVIAFQKVASWPSEAGSKAKESLRVVTIALPLPSKQAADSMLSCTNKSRVFFVGRPN